MGVESHEDGEPPRGTGHPDGGNEMAAAHKNRRRNAAKSSFQLLMIRCVALTERQIEDVQQIRLLAQCCGREAGHAVALHERMDPGIGEVARIVLTAAL
jgi:hypothetical protein